MHRTVATTCLAPTLACSAACAERIDIAAGKQDVTIVGAHPEVEMTRWHGSDSDEGHDPVSRSGRPPRAFEPQRPSPGMRSGRNVSG